MSMKLIMERWRMHAKTQNVIVESEKHSSIEDFEIDDVIQKTEIWKNALQLGRLLARRNPYGTAGELALDVMNAEEGDGTIAAVIKKQLPGLGNRAIKRALEKEIEKALALNPPSDKELPPSAADDPDQQKKRKQYAGPETPESLAGWKDSEDDDFPKVGDNPNVDGGGEIKQQSSKKNWATRYVSAFPEMEYAVEGDTHGLFSHMLKHYYEFVHDGSGGSYGPLLNKIKQVISKYVEDGGELYIHRPAASNLNLKTGERQNPNLKSVERLTPEIIGDVTGPAVTNTLDYIQDRVKLGQPLIDVEKEIYKLAKPVADEYNKMAREHAEGALHLSLLDFENNTESLEMLKNVVRDAYESGRTIAVRGVFKDKYPLYYVNNKGYFLSADPFSGLISTYFVPYGKAGKNPDKNMAGNCKNFKDVENQHIEAKIFRSAIGCLSKDSVGVNEARCVKRSKNRRLNLKIERKK